MRIFLAGSPGSGISLLRDLLVTVYAWETRTLSHSSELTATTLPENLLVEFTGHPDATLLGFLPQHGFSLLTTVRHPLDTLLAQFATSPHPDLDTGFRDYAASPQARDLLSLSLEWACVEGSLVIRHEDLSQDPAAALTRILRHLDATPASARTPTTPSFIQADSDWTTRLSADTAAFVYQSHAELFAAWNYLPPLPDHTGTPADIPPPILRIIADLNARNRQLESALERTRTQLATCLPRLSQATLAKQYHTDEISRLKRLIYGARAGQHLYRAWQVILGKKHYRQHRSDDAPTAAPAINPADVSGYHDLFIGDLHVRFHKAAMADNRGTGRVARALFHNLELIAQNTPRDPAVRPVPVHFFAAPHWGPESLPPRSCVLIHDTLPMLTPGYSKGQLAIFENRCRSVIRQAEKLITISQTSAHDISRLLGVPAESLLVILNGVTRLPSEPASAPPLPPAPYLVYVGGADSHKNLEVVLEALSRPAARGLHLTMVGENERHRITSGVFGIEDRVHFYGIMDDTALGHVVSHAAAMVFPSYHEGCGLPPLEAALLGVPSICSRRPAMTELLAGAALFAEPDSPDEWAQRIHALTTCPALRNAVAARARVAAEKFQWSSAAQSYVAAFKAMRQPAGPRIIPVRA